MHIGGQRGGIVGNTGQGSVLEPDPGGGGGGGEGRDTGQVLTLTVVSLRSHVSMSP